MKKRSYLFVALCILGFALLIAGCAGGGSGAADTSSPTAGGAIPVPGSGDGTGTPGSGQTSVSLFWNAPATNTNGSALTDLSGFTVHYGTSSGNYTGKVDVGAVTSCTLTGFAPGTYYFTVTASNKAGVESAYSNEVQKAVAL